MHVDFDTQRRLPKDSALWYRDVIERNGLRRERDRDAPTLEAVAARAGVSRSTVSRVVNGQTTVSAEIRDLVMRAVERAGLRPQPAARSLVTQRTDSIALVVPEPGDPGRSPTTRCSPTIIRSASTRAGGRRQAASC